MLAPFQQTAYNQIKQFLSYGYLVDFYGAPGSGKTLILKELRKEIPGWLLHIHDLMEFFEKQEPGHGKDVWYYRQIKMLLDDQHVIYIDDYDLIQQACSERSAGWEMARKSLANIVLEAGKRLVFVGASGDAERSYSVTLPEMTADDRRVVLTEIIQQIASFFALEAHVDLDFPRIWAAAPELNGHQLRRLCTVALKKSLDLSTDLILKVLDELQLAKDWEGS